LEHAAAARTGHLFTIFGPAGVGKSRLVAAFLAEIVGRAVQLRGRCLAYGDGITFWPLVSMVRQAAKLATDLPANEARARIAGLVAGEDDADEIADRIASVAGLLEPQASAEEIAWALRRLVESLAREAPVALVVDDVHWAEPAFLDLLEELARSSRETPVLIVCLARLELLESQPTWGGGSPNATAILLEPLSEADSTRLIGDVLGAGTVDPAVTRTIVEAAGGNPLFLEEIVATLVEEGSLRRAADGSWQADDLSSIRIPATIQALLAARIDRLTTEERTVLETAAVMGTTFRQDALAALTQDDEPERDLASLSRKELIKPGHGLSSDTLWEFGHVLVRDAAYASIPKARRARLHEQHAGWAERTYGSRVVEIEEIVGYHLEQAFRYRAELGRVGAAERALATRASSRLASAGRRASARGDPQAAAKLLRRAASVLPDDAPDGRLMSVEAGSALNEAGRFAEAADVLDGASRSAAAAGDDRVRWRATVERLLGELQTEMEKAAVEVPSVVQRARPVFEAHGDEPALCRLWRLQALVAWIGPSAAAADRAWEKTAEYARRIGDESERADSLCWLASSAFFGSIPADEGVGRCEDILGQVRGNRRAEAQTLQPLAGLHAMSGRFDAASEGLERCHVLFDNLGVTTHSAISHHEVLVAMFAGELAVAEELLRTGYHRLDEMGERAILSTTAALLADVLCRQGRFEEAEPLTRESEETAAGGDLSAQIAWRRVRARVLARQGLHDEARALAVEAVSIAGETDWLNMRGDALLDLGEVLVTAGRPREADMSLREAVRVYECKGNVVSAARARALLADHGQA
jgi:tetratricopeptide (TPR) repeat protein